MEQLVRLRAEHAGQVLTLQRAAYVTEAQAHDDLDLPALRQTLTDLQAELGRDDVLALGWRSEAGRLLEHAARTPGSHRRLISAACSASHRARLRGEAWASQASCTTSTSS